MEGWDILLFAPDYRTGLRSTLIPELENPPVGRMPVGCGVPDKCHYTVAINRRCYAGYAVNYVMWGMLNRLCGKSLAQANAVIAVWKFGAYADYPTPETLAWASAGWWNGPSIDTDKSWLVGQPSEHEACTSCPTPVTIPPTSSLYRWKGSPGSPGKR